MGAACDCVSREGEDKPVGQLPHEESCNASEHGGSPKRRLSQGKLTGSGRCGDIVAADPHDNEHTYKMEFTDGQMPAVDWVRGDSVELIGASFSVVLRDPKSDVETTLNGNKPNDTLSNLYSNAEKELDIEHGSLHLSLPENETQTHALDDRLGALGLIEGTKVEYFVVDNFDKSLVRVERKSHSGFGGTGAEETQTVVAAVYGKKGTTGQLLLWAEECLTEASSPKHGANSAAPCAELSSDMCELLLTRPGADTRRHPISSLIIGARSKEKASLDDQFKALLGEEKWPGYTGRVCRQIS